MLGRQVWEFRLRWTSVFLRHLGFLLGLCVISGKVVASGDYDDCSSELTRSVQPVVPTHQEMPNANAKITCTTTSAPSRPLVSKLPAPCPLPSHVLCILYTV